MIHTFTNMFCLYIAVAEKKFLEGETGLKIIQTGVGEVRMSSNHKSNQPIYRLVIMGTGWYNEALSLVSQQQNRPHRSLFST